MTAFYASMSEDNAPPIPKLHQYWIAEPYKKGRNLNYWGYTKAEAYNKAKLNNPNANVILWKKEI